MEHVLSWVFAALIIVTCVLSALNSYRSRATRDMRLRGLFSARMNINMGLMLIFISLIQMLMFSGSSIRVVIGSLFFVLGLFNLFAGLRNHSHYSRTAAKDSEQS